MDSNETSAVVVLSAAEARVLGCLIEKEATTPDAYPLTVNAASLACNKLNQLADEAGVRDRYGYMAAVLEQSILRGWEGLFALKDDFVDAVPTQRPASTEDRPREIGPDTDIRDFLGGF